MGKKVLKSSNHRWMSLFFIGAAVLAYFFIDAQSNVLKALVVGGCGFIAAVILLKRSEDRLWIENEKLYFEQVRGAKVIHGEIAIKDIKSVKLKFSGHHGSNQGWVRDQCLIITNDAKTTSLPQGIKYSAYNPRHAGMSYLMNPLRQIKPDIGLEIDDSEVVSKSKPDFSNTMLK